MEGKGVLGVSKNKQIGKQTNNSRGCFPVIRKMCPGSAVPGQMESTGSSPQGKSPRQLLDCFPGRPIRFGPTEPRTKSLPAGSPNYYWIHIQAHYLSLKRGQIKLECQAHGKERVSILGDISRDCKFETSFFKSTFSLVFYPYLPQPDDKQSININLAVPEKKHYLFFPTVCKVLVTSNDSYLADEHPKIHIILTYEPTPQPECKREGLPILGSLPPWLQLPFV